MIRLASIILTFFKKYQEKSSYFTYKVTKTTSDFQLIIICTNFFLF
jgi:hypothetical protein